MKLAVSTLVAYQWSLEQTLAVCRREGIEAIEIRLGIHEWSNLNLEMSDWQEISAKIKQSGIQVSNLGTGIVINGYEEAAFTELKQCIAIAKQLDCRGLRIMLGNFRNLWSETVPEVDTQGIIRWLQAADKLLAESGTEIWIETHNEFASVKSLYELLEQAKVSCCRILWDLMHTIEVDEKPEETMSYATDRVVHVHIKDGRPWENVDKANWKYTRLGEGLVPIKEALSLLEQAGYQGYYSLEWEEMWRKELESETIDKEAVVKTYREMMEEMLCC